MVRILIQQISYHVLLEKPINKKVELELFRDGKLQKLQVIVLKPESDDPFNTDTSINKSNNNV